MEYKTFLGKVHQKAHMADLEEAVGATRATLTVFARRLTPNERKDLAAQLPEEIGVFLKQEGEAERFGLQEFYQRVQEKEGVDMPDSVHHAQAVIAVLQDAVSRGELSDIKTQLPSEFNPLFESDPR
jgi:uncharacterized protein (DUF2267 family)